jgi:hypothetical protein
MNLSAMTRIADESVISSVGRRCYIMVIISSRTSCHHPSHVLSLSVHLPTSYTKNTNMKLLLLSFLLYNGTLSYAKDPQIILNTLRKDPNAEGENQTFGRLLMKGVISPSNDVDKIKNRKKRRGLRKVVVVPPKTMVQKK